MSPIALAVHCLGKMSEKVPLAGLSILMLSPSSSRAILCTAMQANRQAATTQIVCVSLRRARSRRGGDIPAGDRQKAAFSGGRDDRRNRKFRARTWLIATVMSRKKSQKNLL